MRNQCSGWVSEPEEGGVGFIPRLNYRSGILTDDTRPAATVSELVDVARWLSSELALLRFSSPVSHVYNALEYAWDPHAKYLERYGETPGREAVFLGMNPGPWGMAQTGVPFGEIELVRDWLGIEGTVVKPAREHPKRPVEGFACRRSEVSGRRLWGWARDRFETAENFFNRFFVANYCPLMFLEASGRNRTPDKLPAAERGPLLEACDEALRRTVAVLRPEVVIGIGRFTHERAVAALEESGQRVGRILHPSPASPQANRGWAGQATRQLLDLGIGV